MASDEIREVVQKAEAAVGAVVFTTPPTSDGGAAVVASAIDALRAAAALAEQGKRASALIAPSDVLDVIGVLHAIARARLPILVHVVGGIAEGRRAGRDEIGPVLDAGAGVLVTWSAQESIDLALAARRAAEDSETPFVIVSDGGGLVMSLPGSGLVSKFLGEATFRPKSAAASAFGDAETKRLERSFAKRVPFALAGAMRELGDLSGRPLGAIERHETTDAEEMLVAFGQAFPAARAAADTARREGRKVGAIGVRALRPLFTAELVKASSRARAIAVLEPLDIALAPAGRLAQCLKAAFVDALTWAPGFPGVGRVPTIVSVPFATVNGMVGEAEARAALVELAAGDRARRLVVLGSEG